MGILKRKNKLFLALKDGVLQSVSSKLEEYYIGNFDFESKGDASALARSLPGAYCDMINSNSETFSTPEYAGLSEVSDWDNSRQIEWLYQQSIAFAEGLDEEGILGDLIKRYYKNHGPFRGSIQIQENKSVEEI